MNTILDMKVRLEVWPISDVNRKLYSQIILYSHIIHLIMKSNIATYSRYDLLVLRIELISRASSLSLSCLLRHSLNIA